MLMHLRITLAVLKAELGRVTARHVECSEAHDRVANGAYALRERVRVLRLAG